MVNILTIGDSPYIHLYNWTFNKHENIKTYHQTSKKYKIIINDLHINTDNYYPTSSVNAKIEYDYIFINSNSLEDLNTNLATINDSLISSKTKLIIDNTGSIPLNDFVAKNYSKLSNAVFLLNQINISPVKFEKNTITYTLAKNNDNNILLENNDTSFNVFMTKHFANFNVIMNLPNFNQLVYKYNIHFTIIQSLMLIFELDSIQQLEKFILCKPILKGLFNEIININSIKEETDFKSVKAYFKWLHLNENLMHPLEIQLFDLNLDNSFDINILYPILLADDLSMKIPYLEFLYSILQQLKQYKKTNVRFLNKLMYSNKLKELNAKLLRLENNLNDENNVLRSELESLQTDNSLLNQQNAILVNENASLKSQLEIQVNDLQKRLNDENIVNKQLVTKLENVQLQPLKDEEPDAKATQKTYRKSVNSQLRLMLSDDDVEDFVDANDSPVMTDTSVKNRRSIQGVNAQFNSHMSNTDLGIKALEEVQMFSEYGIFYGSPKKALSEDLQVEINDDTNNSDADKTQMNEDVASSDTSDLKRRELELNQREMILKQREQVYNESLRKLPQPPKQQFPPMPRKPSLNNLQRGSVYQPGPQGQQIPFNPQGQQIPFNPQGQQVPFQPQGQQVPFNPQGQQVPFQQQVPFHPQGQQVPFNPPTQYNQQAQYNMPYNPQPGMPPYGRSISQPVQSFNPPPSMSHPVQSFNPPTSMSHPVHMKTSRKNRQSVIPTASKMKQNDMLQSESMSDYPGFTGSYNTLSSKNSSGNLLSHMSQGSLPMNQGNYPASANISQNSIVKKPSVGNFIQHMPQNTSAHDVNPNLSASSINTGPPQIAKAFVSSETVLNVALERTPEEVEDFRHNDVKSDEFKFDTIPEQKPVEKMKKKKSLNIFGSRKSSQA